MDYAALNPLICNTNYTQTQVNFRKIPTTVNCYIQLQLGINVLWTYIHMALDVFINNIYM